MNKIKYIFLLSLSLIFLVLCIASASYAEDIKKADLAGTWYSSKKGKLNAIVGGFIRQADIPPINGRIIGMISPHAGYAYSGRTAGYGFKAVQAGGYKTVIIVGFTHKKRFNGISVYDRGIFQTPLGKVEIDLKFAKELIAQNDKISFYPELFKDENSVEMLIPFVQVALTEAKIVPVAIGTQDYMSCDILGNALSTLIKDREDILIIASTDMSHYHTYDDANKIDGFAVETLERGDPGVLHNMARSGSLEFCGLAPVVSTMIACKNLGADNVQVLKYENSGDTAGEKSRVVGYVSAVFSKKGTKGGEKMDGLSEKQKGRLLEIARRTMEEYIKNGKRLEFEESDPELLKEKGAFVTIHYKGDLKGCIGNIIGRGPLYKTIRNMAIASSTEDNRFSPVTAKQVDDIHIEISVLSVPEKVTDVSKIVMGEHGVIVRRGARSGVFLPQVATETGWSREEFLSNLCAHKAGLAPDAWKNPATELHTFTAQVFGEE